MINLQSIESQYGCVAEYNRCLEEEDARRHEQAYQTALRYEDSRRQIDEYIKAGYIAIAEGFCGVDGCGSCRNRTETFYSDECDDIGTFFCFNKCCKHDKN